MTIHKKDVIQHLEEIALYLELQGENAFRINAYRRAAQSLERDERSLAEIDQFTDIKGIGKGTNQVILEFIEKGQSEILTNLKKEVPERLISLLKLPGLGGKRIAKLYQELNITNIESLKEACLKGEVEKLAGFGKKTVGNLLKSIEELHKNPERFPFAWILPIVDQIEEFLSDIPLIEKFSVAGSFRRRKEMLRDIDFILSTDEPEAVQENLLTFPAIKDVISKGLTKVSVVIADEYDVPVDFRLVKPHEFATTLHHFTGSKEHNIAMRQLAKTKGVKISEYGIEKEETEKKMTFPSEKDFFAFFNLKFIPPEMRENTGEIKAFQEQVSLIKDQDIRGDLHIHTTWSDGAQSIEEMVLAAMDHNYEYIAITDHSKFLRVANGLNEERLLRQREEIARLNEKYPDIHILSGVEMDILPDGSLDFSNDFLKEMDFVIAAIHSGFEQSEEQLMRRIYRALENPYVDLLAHPTGRLIGRRTGYPVNMKSLLKRAKETNTAIEINANPNRWDLSAKNVEIAHELGVLLAINTDAHHENMLDHMTYGVSVGKKGWLKKESVLNTWPFKRLKDYLHRNKK